MITVQRKLPRKIYLAVSGGVDSIAALHFLSRNHDVTALHVNHAEGNSNESEQLVSNVCSSLNIPLYIKRITTKKPNKQSLEEFWRNERYAFFHKFDGCVITAHTLDDCVETWLWSSMHGLGKIIPYANRNVIRPFRLVRKQQLVDWAVRHGISWVEDASNANQQLVRNYIRKTMMPHVQKVNPGIYKVIKKKVVTDYE